HEPRNPDERILNQHCPQAPDLESMLLARMRKIVFATKSAISSQSKNRVRLADAGRISANSF
ncbi:MAG: hypothetical protein WAM17_10640, partial [Rhodoplanes sp.]